MTWREMVPAGALSLRGENRVVMFTTWWNVALLVLSVAALPFDRRRILGLNPWVKPIKFEISVIVFLVTMAVLLSMVGRLGESKKARRFIGWTVGLAMIVENTIIALQSLRGARSHMNFTSVFNGVAFGVMGVFIALNTLAVAVLLVLYLVRRPGLPSSVVWGVRLGLLVVLLGSVEGS